jgi:hypothetical protein
MKADTSSPERGAVEAFADDGGPSRVGDLRTLALGSRPRSALRPTGALGRPT